MIFICFFLLVLNESSNGVDLCSEEVMKSPRQPRTLTQSSEFGHVNHFCCIIWFGICAESRKERKHSDDQHIVDIVCRS